MPGDLAPPLHTQKVAELDRHTKELSFLLVITEYVKIVYEGCLKTMLRKSFEGEQTLYYLL